MRVYISGPITGTDDYKKGFSRAEKELIMQGYSVVNPAKVNAQMPEDMEYGDYMKMCFEMLDLCDAICMIPGWEKSNGAKREYSYAFAKDITIFIKGGWK